MSRYALPAHDPTSTVVVGWDHPLQTYVAQVFDPTRPATEDADTDPVYWIGGPFHACPTMEALQEQLRGWATLPPPVVEALYQDKQTAQLPTPLQARMARRERDG